MKIDYEKIGFKAGLEIHQQLNSGKLFCNCPSVLNSDKPIFEVSRHLHRVPGESGEFDVAASYQSTQEKEFIYGAHNTTCLVELDEEPPHELNPNALYIAMQIAELLHCKIIPITQVMRKTVIDGSNTSGFQRTVMYARDGYVETSKGKVKINFILLEEDSARRSKEVGNKIHWNLDRLGIPLVEVVTAPEIKDAAHAKETGLKIGEILRSCNVRRGIGTIRQDINISIKGSNRVEIKGFQDPKIMEECVNNEILRQKGLLELSKDISLAKFGEVKSFDLDVNLEWMKKEINNGSKFVGVKVLDYRGVFGKELFSDYRVGTDLSFYAKAKGFGGLIHGDEDLKKKYKLSEKEIEKIKKIFELKKKDSFVMILGEEEKAKTLFKDTLIPRIKRLKLPNSSEVRNCLPSGKTGFLRPMPGSARMYPETDLKLLHISRDLINKVKKDLPKTKEELEKELKKEGLAPSMIKIILKENKFEEFKEIVSSVGIPSIVGKVLVLFPKEISAKGIMSLEEINEILNVDKIVYVLEKFKKGAFSEGDLKEVLERIVKGVSLEKAVQIEKADNSKVEEFISKIIQEKPGLRANAYMGLVMKKFKGKINGKEVMRIIGELVR